MRIESRGSVAEVGTVDVYVWNGASWVYVGSVDLSLTTYSWAEIDVSATLNTWAKINGVEVYLHYTKYLTGTGYVRRLTRKVDYTAAPPVAGGILAQII